MKTYTLHGCVEYTPTNRQISHALGLFMRTVQIKITRDDVKVNLFLT